MQMGAFVKTGLKSQKGGLVENKGLCSTCVYDAKCVFVRVFPIMECEEFSDVGSEHGKKIKKKEKIDRVRGIIKSVL